MSHAKLRGPDVRVHQFCLGFKLRQAVSLISINFNWGFHHSCNWENITLVFRNLHYTPSHSIGSNKIYIFKNIDSLTCQPIKESSPKAVATMLFLTEPAITLLVSCNAEETARPLHGAPGGLHFHRKEPGNECAAFGTFSVGHSEAKCNARHVTGSQFGGAENWVSPDLTANDCFKIAL